MGMLERLLTVPYGASFTNSTTSDGGEMDALPRERSQEGRSAWIAAYRLLCLVSMSC